MTISSTSGVTLQALKPVPDGERGVLLAGIAGLQLGPGQEGFVGDPHAMAVHALRDPARHPFAITVPGRDPRIVGMGVLHVGAAPDAGWPSADGAILLRGFLVDHRAQGHGYGTAAAVAAVGLAQELVARLALPATGVVLGVNERNAAGQAAYRKAGFTDAGRFLGGRSGPQRIMHRSF